MESLRMSTNMLLSRWSNQGVNLWAVDLVSVTLVEGQSTYNVDASTVTILDVYVRNSDNIDRIVMPISRSEYANYPNKTQEGFPTVFWFDRLLSPTITIWPVPDGTSSTTLKYYRMRRLEDAALTNGQTVDIPYLWLEAFALALAQRLALIWAPDKIQLLKPLADEAYSIAIDQNVETAQQYIAPITTGYWRA